MSKFAESPRPCFALVRARHDLHALRRGLRARGLHSLGLPGFELEPLPAVESGAASRADGLIVVSPFAARCALRCLGEALQRPEVDLFAVGNATARVLREHGLREVIAPSAEPGQTASEALLALPALASVMGKRFCVLGAAGGRERIQEGLRARGAQVDEIHLYRRRGAHLGTRRLARLRACLPYLELIASSAAGLEGVRDALPGELWAELRQRPLIASSRELAAIARELGFKSVNIADSALAADLLAAACARTAAA